MMQLLLDEIADVRTGLTLRGADAATRTVAEGPHYLRISDLSDSGKLNITETQPIDPALDPEHRHRVRVADILMANRGTRMTAVLVTEDIDAIASSQLFIIRLKSHQISPAYLHAFLNLHMIQEFLRSHARGTYVQTLSIGILRSLSVPLIPLEDQHKIATLNELAHEEACLTKELSEKRLQFVNLSLSRLLSKSI
jgi:hypothetical protein